MKFVNTEKRAKLMSYLTAKYANTVPSPSAIVSLPPRAIFNFKIHFPLKYWVRKKTYNTNVLF